MNCKEKDNLTAYLDGELIAAEAGRLRAHIATCAECRAEIELLRRSYDALGYLDDVSVPEALAPRIQARMRHRSVRPVFAFAGLAAAMALMVLALSTTSRMNFTLGKKAPVLVATPSPDQGILTAEDMDAIGNLGLLDEDILGDLGGLVEFASSEDFGESDATSL
jgi:anti-sigma factor RsiW